MISNFFFLNCSSLIWTLNCDNVGAFYVVVWKLPYSNTIDTIRKASLFFYPFIFSPTTVISLSFETSSLFPDTVPKVTGIFFNLTSSFLFHIRILSFLFVKQVQIFATLDCSSTVMFYFSFLLLLRLPKPVMFNKWALSSLAIHDLNDSSRERVLLPLGSTLIQLQVLIYAHQLPILSHFLHCLKHLAGILSVWPLLVIRRAGESFFGCSSEDWILLRYLLWSLPLCACGTTAPSLPLEVVWKETLKALLPAPLTHTVKTPVLCGL